MFVALKRAQLLITFGSLLACGILPAAAQAPSSASDEAHIADAYGSLPLSFEANQGQTDPRARFIARGNGYGLYLTAQSAVLSLSRPAAPSHAGSQNSAVVTMRVQGAQTGNSPVGERQLPGDANYFIGSDPSAWHRDVPTYSAVRYPAVYPGVDLVYYGNQRQLEYDFVVAAHANPDQIHLDFDGVKKVTLDQEGTLVLKTNGGQVSFRKPVVYQERDGHREMVQARFTLGKRHSVGFQLGDYDHSEPLVIDPVLTYSTFLGGTGANGDAANAIAVDGSGNAYITGYTDSGNFPVTGGAYQQTYLGTNSASNNAFVAKMNPTGTGLVYSTFLGGGGSTRGYTLAIDAAGDAYVGGSTAATNFPVTAGAVQTVSPASSTGYVGFVTKLNPTGSALLYSTYLGGSGNGTGTGDEVNSLAVDAAGEVFAAGYAYSLNFPTTAGAFQVSNAGAPNLVENAFVAKLNAQGSALVYSTLLGGSGTGEWGEGDVANAVAIDASGEAVIAGQTGSVDFPISSGAYQSTNTAWANTETTAFVTKLNATGTALVYSTFLGGSSNAAASSLALDNAGDVYIAGYAKGTDFPATPGAFQTVNNAAGLSAGNAFVAKFSPDASQLIYATLLGGNGMTVSAFNPNGEAASSLVVDASGDAYVAGVTFSTNFPVTSGAYQTSSNAAAHKGSNGFVTEINPTGSALVYSTYIGGSGYPFGGMGYYRGDDASALALDALGNVYVAGITWSQDFPVTASAFQPSNHALVNEGSNAFVSELSFNRISTVTTLTPSANPVSTSTAVTFTAAVAASFGSATGNVIFSVDGATAATVALASGAASYSTSSLTAGAHTVTATYSGTATFPSSSASITETVVVPAVAPPALYPAVGTYTAAQQVLLSTATTGATVYYTTDGTAPSTTSNRYTAALQIAATTTIHAMAAAPGYANSVVAAGTYTIMLPATAPSFSLAAGTYAGPQSVTLSCSSAGATIYYSTNGVAPTTASAKYIGAIPVSSTETIMAIAVAPGMSTSPVATGSYSIQQAAMLSPAAGAVLAGPNATFAWTAGSGATSYMLYLGTTGVGAHDIHASAATTATSLAVTGLPTNGKTIYVRLFTTVSGKQTYADYTYTAATQSALTAPTAGSVFAGSSVTFSWSTAANATGYYLWIGSTGVGSNNIYNSALKTVTSYTFTAMPTNGETIYVRLITNFGGTWVSLDSTYTAATKALLTLPAAGSTFTGSSVAFSWSAAPHATGYYLWIGTTGVGSNNLYNSALKTVTSYTFTGMPLSGATIYVRLITNFSGVWTDADYTFTAAAQPATMIAPAAGGKLTGASATFSWTSAAGATDYYLLIGTTGVGSNNLYSSAPKTVTSYTFNVLPTNGETIYVRLYTNYSGTWVPRDYTYTAE